MDFPGVSDSKESACNAGDLGLIPGSGRSPGEGKGYLLIENHCSAAAAAAAAAKSLQSYPTLCNPMDGSPPGSPVPGTLQATVLEWGAICFFNS